MTGEQSPSLLNVGAANYELVELSDDLSWLVERLGRFVKGGIYLIAGQPGIGKSTLALQIALDLGRRKVPSLYVLTEQSVGDLAARARLMTSHWPLTDANQAMSMLRPEEYHYDIDELPTLLSHEVLSPSGKFHDAKFIVVDSIQGQGLAAAATKKYRQVYEFCRQCKSNGLTVLLVAHVTKKGEIAGPKDLEHNVDCVLVMRKAMAFRPMFIPKNRFGPAIFKPIPLEMDKQTTALKLAPHSTSISTVARTFLGRDSSLPEVQAAVSLPSYGTRGRITAPGLPRKEIEQLANCISQIPDVDIGDLDYTIHCRLPGGRVYRAHLGLALSIALIASYLQKDIPAHHIYLGEIDLLRKVRDVPVGLLTDLVGAIADGELLPPLRIFLPRSSAAQLQGLADGVTVVGCDILEDAVFNTWPDLQR